MKLDRNKHWIGHGLDTSLFFRSNVKTGLCLGSDKYINYISEQYVLDEKNQILEIDSLLNLIPLEKGIIQNRIVKGKEDLILLENEVIAFDRLYKR